MVDVTTPEGVACTSLPIIQKEEVAALQQQDQALAIVRDHVDKGHRPTSRQAQNFPSTSKKLLREWNRFSLKEGLLFRKIDFEGEPIHQLVVPEGMRERVLEAYHDQAGHQGRDRT